METPPLIIDILKVTLENPYYRSVIHTTRDSQVVLMSLRPGEDIPKEVHTGTQFVRVEAGQGEVTIDNITYPLKDGVAVNVPGGHEHYFRATGPDDLKLYTIYSPPVHSKNRLEMIDPYTGQKLILSD